jgi:hypothetical protein
MVLGVVSLGLEPPTGYGKIENNTGNTLFKGNPFIFSSGSPICVKFKSCFKDFVSHYIGCFIFLISSGV